MHVNSEFSPIKNLETNLEQAYLGITVVLQQGPRFDSQLELLSSFLYGVELLFLCLWELWFPL